MDNINFKYELGAPAISKSLEAEGTIIARGEFFPKEIKYKLQIPKPKPSSKKEIPVSFWVDEKDILLI